MIHSEYRAQTSFVLLLRQPINRPFPTQRLVNRFLTRSLMDVFFLRKISSTSWSRHRWPEPLCRWSDIFYAGVRASARLVLITDHCLNNSMRWKCISAHRSDRSMCYFSLCASIPRYVQLAIRFHTRIRYICIYSSQLKQLVHCLGDEIRTKKRKRDKLFSISTCSRKLLQRNSFRV